ncbi:hypothetical protein DFJ73DRAFT_824092 [Zopfochytrium polystomum]|nr:hypothetical protein DFJ73DRAFT_824092 [Zopfochytrium polystomum]
MSTEGAGSTGPEDYYELLRIDRSADADAIKRGYRKEALRYHPDKNTTDPNAPERFQRIQKAYETLSDPKKRQMYDKYGERGVAMMDNAHMVPFLNPEVFLMMNQVFAVLSTIVILLLLFLILISLRADGSVSFSWVVVFIPSFIVLAFFLAFVTYGAVKGDSDEADDGASTHSKSEKPSILERIGSVVYVALLFAFDILLALRLDNHLDSWAVTFAPWFIIEVLHFIAAVQGLLAKFTEGVVTLVPPSSEEEESGFISRPLTGREKVLETISQFLPWALRVLQVILIVAKLGNPDFAPWVVVFLPIFIQGAAILVMISVTYFQLRQEGDPDALGSVLLAVAVAAIVLGLLYATVGLLIKRLNDGASPPASVILIPSFIVLSILLCCVGVCLPCVLGISKKSVEAELRAEDGEVGGANGTNVIPLSPDRMIASS